MTNKLTLKDSKKYSDLLSKQFNKIGRYEMFSNEETWALFLKQPLAQEIDPSHLPIVKGYCSGYLLYQSKTTVKH